MKVVRSALEVSKNLFFSQRIISVRHLQGEVLHRALITLRAILVIHVAFGLFSANQPSPGRALKPPNFPLLLVLQLKSQQLLLAVLHAFEQLFHGLLLPDVLALHKAPHIVPAALHKNVLVLNFYVLSEFSHAETELLVAEFCTLHNSVGFFDQTGPSTAGVHISPQFLQRSGEAPGRIPNSLDLSDPGVDNVQNSVALLLAGLNKFCPLRNGQNEGAEFYNLVAAVGSLLLADRAH